MTLTLANALTLKKKGGVNMSDLINYADYDRIAEIFGFDDPENPLFARPQTTKESDEDDNQTDK